MLLRLTHDGNPIQERVQITGSKSETNRLLILQALFQGLTIDNISNSDDAAVMQKALKTNEEAVDIHHAGTAMRFLTAYFAIQEGRNTLLTGSPRMQERPVGILVEALRSIGAKIEYAANEGYPPLKIQGRLLQKNEVELKANVSSQYISALMLIGGALPKGLTIRLNGKITSVPYINMTLKLLEQVGIEATFEGQQIHIKSSANSLREQTMTVESDWSSASYFFSVVALIPGAKVAISSYKEDSLQGDAVLIEIYKMLGVQATFDKDVLYIENVHSFDLPELLELNLANSPDIAQTIAVSCLGLGIGCKLTGLHTLKIKETDRLEALKTEITKLGGTIEVTNDSLFLETQKISLKDEVAIATYHDHRMAMAFAPLAVKVPLQIEDAGVVSKSYPEFWKDMEQLGFVCREIIIG